MCQSANDSKESGSSLLNFHENLSCFAGAECFSSVLPYMLLSEDLFSLMDI